MKFLISQFIASNNSNETMIFRDESLSTRNTTLHPREDKISQLSTASSPSSIVANAMTNALQSEKIIIYSILFLVSSIGNTSSFITLLLKKKKAAKSRVRLLFLNLCVADLLVTRKLLLLCGLCLCCIHSHPK